MIVAISLLLAACVWRLLFGLQDTSALAEFAGWQNFSPMAAIALCGAAYLPKRLAVVLPVCALLVTDIVLNAHYGFPTWSMWTLPRYACYAAIAAYGWTLRDRASWAHLIPSSIGASLVFYIVSNTFSWIADPNYVKNLAGWWQALTVGTPGHAPTWMFYVNTFVSDVGFTSLFVACMQAAKPHQDGPSGSVAPSAA